MALMVVLLLVAFRSALTGLFELWWSTPDYGHGFFVPIAAAFFVYKSRKRWRPKWDRELPLSAILSGVVLLLVSFGALIFGILSQVLSIQGLATILSATAIAVILCGWGVLRVAWPAILFLLLMLPVPRSLLNPLRSELQSIATTASVFSLQTLGLPAVSRGNVIILPNAEVGVAEACSGLRMLVAFASLVCGMVMFFQRTKFETAILLASIVPITVIVNAWRVVVVAVATHYRPSIADTVHDIAGLAMMLLAMFLLWLLIQFLDQLFTPSDAASYRSQQAMT